MHRALPVERAVLTLVVRLDRGDHLAGLLIGEQHGALVVAGHLQETQSLREPWMTATTATLRIANATSTSRSVNPALAAARGRLGTAPHSRRFFTRPVTASMVTR